jgi:hypothetical protein
MAGIGKSDRTQSDSVIDDNNQRIADQEGLTREQREAEQQAYGNVRQELDLDQHESRRLHGPSPTGA